MRLRLCGNANGCSLVYHAIPTPGTEVTFITMEAPEGVVIYRTYCG